MNYLDLFHGIGGFALGAYWAGMKFENHYCSDVEKYCQELYALRFPDSIQLGDITKIDFEELPKGDWIITGGFPCQDISIAGKGAGIEGKRSGLWSEYWRAIRVLRPRYAIIENVGAITFRGLDTVLSSLAEIGYNAEWQDIRASDMGAPHKRERIWIVAYTNKTGLQKKRPEQQTTGATRSFTQNEISYTKQQHDDNSGYGASQIQRKRSETTEIQGCLSNSTRKLPYGKRKAWSRRREPSNCDWWSIEPSVGRLANGIPGRVDQLKGLGNSIVPQIAELLFNLIKSGCEEK